MISIIGDTLYQWDLGRKVKIEPKDTDVVDYVHYNDGSVVAVKKVGNHYEADIPNILLQSQDRITVYAVMVSSDEVRTTKDCWFNIRPKQKPVDYVYEETEVLTYKALEEKFDEVLKNLGKDHIEQAVNDYLAENPVSVPVTSINGKKGDVQITAEDVGAIPTSQLEASIETALNQAKESGQFNGKDGVDGKDGADGYTPVKDTDYFDGKDGVDGKDGTSVTVKSVSESSADGGNNVVTFSDGKTLAVKNGSKGSDGSSGKDGTSVTITNITESTTDKGSNVVTFSDGKTLTIKNGSKGSDGAKGDKGDKGDQGLQGIQGEKGDKGDKGADGSSGKDGKDGADGKSAFEYAQEGGYEGTETEFAEKLAEVESLKPSVKSYGAKGDGTTDDTEAFQTALETERVLFVPGGTYKLNGTLVIKENSCLELSQDTILKFTNTSGNCIEMRGSAVLRGNHGNIDVTNNFTGNVISVDTGLDGVVHANIPPYQKATPLWKRQRFIYDVNITRTHGGFQQSLDGSYSGTALYISANYETEESYDGSSTAPISCIWAMTVSGLRIGGAFEYGINIQNRDKTASGYGDAKDPAWNHDMRIEAVIVACATGVRVFNCNTAHLDVSVEPAQSINNVNGAKVIYAKNGIILEHSHNIDLSQSIVWDWHDGGTLYSEENKQNAHISLIGDCRGTILSDHNYHERTEDVRSLIYTDTPSNFDNLIIVQEPFTRWFKPIDGVPYFYPYGIENGGEKRLITKEDLDSHFTTDIVNEFTNVLPDAIDTDETIFNKLGYVRSGYSINSNGVMVTDPFCGCTGYISVKQGDEVYVHGINVGKGNSAAIFVLTDGSFNKLSSYLSNNTDFQTNGWFMKYTALDNGFKLVVDPNKNLPTVAYLRFSFLTSWLPSTVTPMVAINEELKTSFAGFLADDIKVKAENVIGLPSGTGGSTVQADLSQNDETAPDYVKGRTHWRETITILPENEFAISDSFLECAEEADFEFVAGTTYLIKYNGVKYECVAKIIDGLTVVGNPLHFGLEDDTGEPFVMFINEGYFCGIVSSDDTSTTATCEIKKCVYHPLGIDYLPSYLQKHIIVVPKEEITNERLLTLSEPVDNVAPILYNGGEVWLDLSGDNVSAFRREKVIAYTFVFVDDVGSLVLETPSHTATLTGGTWQPPT